MFTCVAVSANSASAIKTILPPSINQVWVSDLTALALRDIRQGLFGARRHELGEYTLVYRLDLSPSLLQTITMTGKGVFTYPIDFPRLRDVIERAKVWLSFDERKLAQKERPARNEDKYARVRRNTIPVSFSKSTVQENMLPSDLKMQWRHTLATLFLSDLEKGLFGARHHSLPCDRSITYRIDVSENILKQVASSPRWTFEENDDKPTINELLSCAKVWLSFPGSQAATALETNDKQLLQANAARFPKVEDIPAGETAMPPPLSPTPSDDTLIDDDISLVSLPSKTAKITVTPPHSPSVKVASSKSPIEEGFFYGNREPDYVAFRRSLGLPPIVPRRRRVDLFTVLKNAATGKSGRPDVFAFGVHRDIEEWGNAF